VLVCVGSAIYTLSSLAFGSTADPSRVAAQVATGMGFLGAGTIIRHGSEVRGLTTAASLWTVAAIGICVGIGGRAYEVAVLGTGVVLLTLTLLRQLELRLLPRARHADLTLRIAGGAERMNEIQQFLATQEVRVESMDVARATIGEGEELHIGIRLPAGADLGKLLGEFSRIRGFQSLRCE
jgi:putative Mg2+ transporter-C (MgtC) family protein